MPYPPAKYLVRPRGISRPAPKPGAPPPRPSPNLDLWSPYRPPLLEPVVGHTLFDEPPQPSPTGSLDLWDRPIPPIEPVPSAKAPKRKPAPDPKWWDHLTAEERQMCSGEPGFPRETDLGDFSEINAALKRGLASIIARVRDGHMFGAKSVRF